MALVGLLLLSAPAHAAVVTRSFSVTASEFINFSSEPAPFSDLAITFKVTYDDTANGFLGQPDSFVAVTDGQTNIGPFSATPAFGYFQASSLSLFPRLVVGGAINGTNVQLNGTNDFFFSFDASAIGTTRAMLSFTNATNITPFVATDAIVSPLAVSAVPEPSTWTLMIGGFGIVGAAVRRRRAGSRRPAQGRIGAGPSIA